MTDNEKTMRICSSCKESWYLPHTYGYETETEKSNWLCGNCFFDKASPSDILKEVFGIDEETAEVLGEFSNQLEQNKERTKIIENTVFSSKEPPKTIYDFDTIWHWIGWPIFLVSSSYIGWKVYKEKNRKKDDKNYLLAICEIFKEWRLNMYASAGAYVTGFFLIQQAIAKWIEPRISNWLVIQKLITIAVVCLVVGIGFYLDGIITSSLKTPLQRLSIKIENANIDEKVKKSLLSKTQQVNELFKETLKRFGLLAVVGILTKLIEAYWNKHILSYLSYGVPIAGAILIIRDVNKTLKKLKLKK